MLAILPNYHIYTDQAGPTDREQSGTNTHHLSYLNQKQRYLIQVRLYLVSVRARLVSILYFIFFGKKHTDKNRRFWKEGNDNTSCKNRNEMSQNGIFKEALGQAIITVHQHDTIQSEVLFH
jgi:hypothetical protein